MLPDPTPHALADVLRGRHAITVAAAPGMGHPAGGAPPREGLGSHTSQGGKAEAVLDVVVVGGGVVVRTHQQLNAQRRGEQPDRLGGPDADAVPKRKGLPLWSLNTVGG